MTAALLRALDARARANRPALLWWRDDDAVMATDRLDRLLRLSETWSVPLTLAVIPEPTGADLAERLAGTGGISVAVHGWSHRNHAPAQEKKQELGTHRPPPVVLAELARGLARLRELHPSRIVPVLVPPWNRIAPVVTEGLPALGFRAVSTFGVPKAAPLRVINTHVDLMDWRGTRRGRPTAALAAELARAIDRDGPDAVGILSHHLVHDAQCWSFLAGLFALTRSHPGCQWVGLADLLGAPR